MNGVNFKNSGMNMDDKTKNFLLQNWFKLFISSMVFCAVLIFAIQIFYLNPKKDDAKAREVAENQKRLDDCVSDAKFSYHTDFVAECKTRNLPSNCSLPLSLANSLEEYMYKSIEQCNKRFNISK